MNNFVKSKEGSFSIKFVIISFIGIMVITGFIDILYKTFIINEVQSTMDVAGNSALQVGIDSEKLRMEIFEIDEGFVRSRYISLVKSLIGTSSNSKVTQFILNDGDISFELINNTWGLGDTTKARPQAIMKSVARVRIKSSSIFDTIPFIQKTFYDSLSNQKFSISYQGITNDGEVELIIRSVCRVVYR